MKKPTHLHQYLRRYVNLVCICILTLTFNNVAMATFIPIDTELSGSDIWNSRPQRQSS